MLRQTLSRLASHCPFHLPFPSSVMMPNLGVILGKFIVAQLVKKFLVLCGSEGSQDSTTCSYLSQMYPVHILFCFIRIHFNNILPSTPGLQVVSSLKMFRLKFCMHC
jgi:hypothetical protein